MHGDFSRNPLAYRDAVSRVLTQQGRVQLDSDANEQTESMLRFLRGLASDVIGPHGGVSDSFKLTLPTNGKPADVLIGWGAYYVDGVRAWNWPPEADVWRAFAGTFSPGDGVPISKQPWYFAPKDGDWTFGFTNDTILLYLDVFERHVSASEDPSLLEVALQGAETASRAVVVWQVRALDGKAFRDRLATVKDVPPMFDKPYVALNLLLRSNARMRARAIVSTATDACTVSPDARFRGTSNSLFRVEVHRGAKDAAPALFKWSEDNGSIVYPVRKIAGKVVHLDSRGRDERTAIHVNDWVEVVDDEVLLNGKSLDLLQVVDVSADDLTVTLSAEPQENAGSNLDRHPILRRWAEDVRKIDEKEGWIELADGVEVQFSHADAPDATFRTGDYWLVPARTSSGNVIWPHEDGKPDVPLAVPPHGVDHHYAPLAMWNRATGKFTSDKFRRSFEPMAKV
jgi:hypothetical protein